MKILIEENDYKKVTLDWNEDTGDIVLRYLIEHYFKTYGMYCGESIMQDDNALIYAPEVLAEIADKILKFEVDYREG